MKNHAANIKGRLAEPGVWGNRGLYTAAGGWIETMQELEYKYA